MFSIFYQNKTLQLNIPNTKTNECVLWKVFVYPIINILSRAVQSAGLAGQKPGGL